MNNKEVCLLVLLSIFFLGCKTNEKGTADFSENVEVVMSDPYAQIILYDNLKQDAVFKTTIDEGVYVPLYIGTLTDSIRLIYKPSKIGHQTGYYKKYAHPVANMEIYIDTSKTIGYPMSPWGYYKMPEYKVDIRSYPVFIKNTSTDTLMLGAGYILPITAEAQDTLGNWILLEPNYGASYGKGLSSFYLPPNQVLITTLKQELVKQAQRYRVFYSTDTTAIYSNIIESTP